MLNAHRGLLCSPFARLCSMLLPGLLVLSFPTTELQAASRPTPVRLSGQLVVSPVTSSPVFLSPDGTVTQPGSFSASAGLTLTGRTRRPPTLTASIECIADDGASGNVWTGTQTLDSSCIPQGDTRNCTVPFKGTWNGDLPDSLSTTATNSELYSCTLAVSLSKAKIEDRSYPFYWLREQAQTIEIVTLEEGQAKASVESSVRSWSDSGDDLPVLIVVEQGEIQTIDDQPISADGEVVISVNAAPEFHVGNPLLVPSSPVVTLGPNHSQFNYGVVVCLTPEVEHQLDPSLDLYSYFPDQNRWISCTDQGKGQCEEERPEGADDAMVCARVFHFSDWAVAGSNPLFRMRFTLEESEALNSQEAGLLTPTEKAIPWNCTEGSSCPSSLPEGALVFSKEVSVTTPQWEAHLQLSQCNASGVCTEKPGKHLNVTLTSTGLSKDDWVLAADAPESTDDNGGLSVWLDSTQRSAWYSIKASISLLEVYNSMGIPLSDITLKSNGDGINCSVNDSEETSSTLIECLNIEAVPDVDMITRVPDGSVTVSASNWTGTGKNLDTGKGTASIGWASEKDCSQSSVMGMPPTDTFNLTDALTNPSGNQTGTLGTPTKPYAYARVGVTYNKLTAWGYCILVSGNDIPDPGDLDSDGDEFTENGEPRDCDDLDPDVNPGAIEACDGIDNNCDSAIDEGEGFTNSDNDEDRDCVDTDDDNDGALDQSDACPTDPDVIQLTPEIPYDGIDQDCDGSDFTDIDGDGFDAVVVGGADCDDSAPTVYPGALEYPGNGKDDDCDGIESVIVQVVAGAYHTLVLDDQGQVWSWGYNRYGQLGDGTTTDRSSPVIVAKLGGIVFIAAGAYHSLAVDSDGLVWAWGYNASGQLGDETTADSSIPSQAPGLGGVQTVAGGVGHSLAQKSDGTVWAWGNNLYGQLGDRTTNDRSSAVQVHGLIGVKAVAGGWYHSLAVDNQGRVWTWGLNTYGQLGDESTTDRSSAVQVHGLIGVKAIAGGGYHSLAVDNQGQAWAWGSNYNSQLGDDTWTDRWAPVQVTGLDGVGGIAAAAIHSIAVKLDGTVWGWGYNVFGQLGGGPSVNYLTPKFISLLNGVSSVSAGALYSLALVSDGSLMAWGSNSFGQHGTGGTSSRRIPDRTIVLKNAVAVAAGRWHSLVLDSEGFVWTWGRGDSGRLGDGSNESRTSPQKLIEPIELSGIVAIAAGAHHSMALDSEGYVWVWGRGWSGQLGTGTYDNQALPVRLTAIPGVVAIAAGDYHSLALLNDGTIMAWGDNRYGQLGNGGTNASLIPTPVSSNSDLTRFVAIEGGYFHTLALDEFGSVWAWGDNSSGQLGDGTLTSHSTPIEALGLIGVKQIAAGAYHSLALGSDGTVWSWGDNYFGSLGNGTTTNSDTPENVPAFGGVVGIAAGYYHSLATRDDGTVWVWGSNFYGQVGDGANSNRLESAKVSGLVVAEQVEAFSVIAGGNIHSLAVLSDGSLAAWGSNDQGQLGIGLDTWSPQPVMWGP